MRLLLVLVFFLYIIFVPLILGANFTTTYKKNNGFLKVNYSYIIGFFVMFALYEIVEVPLSIYRVPFDISCYIFLAISIFACLVTLYSNRLKLNEYLSKFSLNRLRKNLINTKFFSYEKIYMLVAILLFIYQLYHTFFYEINGCSADDESYVTWPSEALYYNEVFPGQMIPVKRMFQMSLFFPAYLTKISGINVVTMSHTILPVIYISVAYMVLFLIANVLIECKEDIYIFMIIVQLVYIYGYYSHYSTTFRLLGPIWQGKAILAVILNPLFMLITLQIVEYGTDISYRVLLFVLSIAAVSLTLGGIISSLAFVSIILVINVIKHRTKEAVRLLLCILWVGIVPVICGIIYMLKK